MSALAEQHGAHLERQARLWRAPLPALPPPPLRPVSPFVARPNWERLFTRPIEALDEHGNVVVASEYMPHWKRITLEVCSKHGVAFREIVSHRRHREICAARHEAVYRLWNETSMSLPQIGRKFDRDHTTALHSIRKHAQTLQREAESGQPLS